MQPDLFADGTLDLKPAPGRAEPRLWVRRLIIWKEPANVVRDISLRPGLNVIWSPDQGSRDGRIGHGGGKTTFCRLVRYCLGEDSVGPETQRRMMLEAMPMAQVGAEVKLDGDSWLIRRSFHPFRDDFALRAASFDELVEFPSQPTGMQPFRDATTQAFLNDALSLVPSSIGEGDAWLALLAWMTRDQECRFGHLLDWRSPDSGSRSPVSGRSRPQEDREAIVRIVLNALRSDEIATRRRLDNENAELNNQRTEVGRLTWQIAGLRTRLAGALGLSNEAPSNLDANIFKTAASGRLTKARGGGDAVTPDQLRTARSEFEKVLVEENETKSAIEIVSNKRESEDRIARMIADQLPELTAQNQRLQYPICPTCGVLIDKARAEGCDISLQSCDLETLRAKVEQQKDTREKAIVEAGRLAIEVKSLQANLALITQTLEQRRAQLGSLESVAFQTSQEIRRAERICDVADEFERLGSELTAIQNGVLEAESNLKTLGAELETHRSAIVTIISELSDRFDVVFRQIVPIAARCSVKLDGSGLRIKVPVDGAAIESLKVTVFDLAVLSMAIEGKTRHPGLLIHDSPREADLGLSIYAGLFELAKNLEGFGPVPLFQYIVTTTTEPPGDFRSSPWCRLELRSAPVEERLLKADL